jgi:glutamine synthetase
MSEQTLNLIKESEAGWVDLRFTDSRGKEQHVTIPSSEVDEDFFDGGKMFDGSSIAGWKGINESDMILMPDDSTSVLDPFTDDTTVILRCDIVEPSTMQGYERDPRSVALRAEEYLKSTGIGDTAFFGPEPEFFVFDDVKWHADMSGAGYSINSEEAAWVSKDSFEERQYRAPPARQGRLLPGTAGRLAARHPRRHVRRHGPRWAWTWKSITTRWAPPASARSASGSTR